MHNWGCHITARNTFWHHWRYFCKSVTSTFAVLKSPGASLCSFYELCDAMIGNSRLNRLSLRNNRLKFTTAGELPIILEEFIGIYPNLITENQRLSTCNPVGLANTRISTDYVCPTISPITVCDTYSLSFKTKDAF